MVFGASLWSWSSSAGNSTTAAQIRDVTREGSALPQQTTITTNTSSPTEESEAQSNETRSRKQSSKSLTSSIATMPTTMSCSQAFDLAMGCGGIGGSFNGVYRYGKWRDCSQQWADWRFCMRTRMYPDDERKKQMIREHYWAKEVAMREGKSSEDVWEERETREEGFFQRDPDRDGIFDGLWMKAPPEEEKD